MPIKIFEASEEAAVEAKVNEYLATIPESYLKDIQYQAGLSDTGYSFSVMIVTKPEKTRQ